MKELFLVGARHEKIMEQIPGMWDQIKWKKLVHLQSPDLFVWFVVMICRKLRSRLENLFPQRCRVLYKTECDNIDFEDNNNVLLENGSKISYDLIVGADGANLMVWALINESDF